MARAKSRKKTKPAVKANSKKIPKLGYGQTNKNINTLRKLEKASQSETDYQTGKK